MKPFITRPRMSAQELMSHIKNTKIFDRVLSKVNILSVEKGSGLAEFIVEEEHTNSMGQLNTGFTVALTDFLTSFSFSSHEFGNNYHVSVDMNFSFYKPEAKLGDIIVVEAKTIKAGRSMGFAEVIMKNKNTGDLIMKGIHNMFVLNPQPKTDVPQDIHTDNK
ncbi:acyl-coenzyme A thioesterase 13-like [Rhynchophorus ferrugineus]|uniref:acyl-coenzyme A thioesterase 13-like n=1 Tax=Rhynchophorus ferrugineus TaxID=354439 RepID=UPI003FCCA70D